MCLGNSNFASFSSPLKEALITTPLSPPSSQCIQHASARFNARFKGTDRQKKTSLFFVRFWLQFAHKCKIENKMRYPSWTFFFMFFMEYELFTEKVIKEGSTAERSNGSTYTDDTYINRSGFLCSINLHSFFSNFFLVFELNVFFWKNYFLPKKQKFQTG